MKKMPLTFLDVEKESTYDLFYVCTSEARSIRGNNFKEKKVVPLIFTQFWTRSHLNNLDPLTSQDIYVYVCTLILLYVCTYASLIHLQVPEFEITQHHKWCKVHISLLVIKLLGNSYSTFKKRFCKPWLVKNAFRIVQK